MAKTSGKKRTKSPGQTIKARALAMEVLAAAERGENPSKGELMRRAGYSPSSADRVKTQPSGAPWTSEAFRDALERSGWGVDRIQEVLHDAARANVVAVYQGDARETDAPDYQTRMRAVKQIAEYTGLAVKRTESKTLNVHASADEAAKLLGI